MQTCCQRTHCPVSIKSPSQAMNKLRNSMQPKTTRPIFSYTHKIKSSIQMIPETSHRSADYSRTGDSGSSGLNSDDLGRGSGDTLQEDKNDVENQCKRINKKPVSIKKMIMET